LLSLFGERINLDVAVCALDAAPWSAAQPYGALAGKRGRWRYASLVIEVDGQLPQLLAREAQVIT
jgi:hypothetical protein